MNQTPPKSNETPPSRWTRPLTGPARFAAWFASLAGAIFLIVCCVALITDRRARSWELIPVALMAAVIVATLACVLLALVRWLCHWRNLRRVLFAVVCLITLAALLIAEENWRGRHAWQKYSREWEARGEKFRFADLVPPPVPDDKNFALTPLLKAALDFTRGTNGIVWQDTNGLARLQRADAWLTPEGRKTNDTLALGSLEKGTFADLAACGEFYRGNTNYPQCSAPAKAAEVILVALGKCAPELQELREAAAARPYSRYPVQYASEPPWLILLPHLARVKSLTTLTHVRATALLEPGQAAEAFDDLKLGLRLSDSIREEPILIDHLVRLSTLAIDLQTVREGLVRHAWTEGQLAELETYFGSLDLLAEYKLAMRGERACWTEGLDYLRRQGARVDPMVGSEDGWPDFPLGPLMRLGPSGWFYQNMLVMARINQDSHLRAVDERAHRVLPDISEQGKRALDQMRTGPFTVFAKMFMPALEKAAMRSGRTQTYADAARVACALERYRLANGGYPDSLAPLVPRFIDRIPDDVIDAKPLRFRLNSDGSYILYSIGWNQTDDGGQLGWRNVDKKNAVDAASGDWVWLMRR